MGDTDKLKKLVNEHNKQYPDNKVSETDFLFHYSIPEVVKIFEDRESKRIDTNYNHPDKIPALDYFVYSYK